MNLTRQQKARAKRAVLHELRNAMLFAVGFRDDCVTPHDPEHGEAKRLLRVALAAVRRDGRKPMLNPGNEQPPEWR